MLISCSNELKMVSPDAYFHPKMNPKNKIENVIIEQSLSLYSDYLQNAENIDVDYTISAFMKINDYLSTSLIVQCRYDDNAVKRVQLREVFGLAVTLDLLEIPSLISKI